MFKCQQQCDFLKHNERYASDGMVQSNEICLGAFKIQAWDESVCVSTLLNF